MARKRDYKKEYVRRDEIARAKGYKGYYDYRLHRYGALPPTAPRPTGRRREELARGTREKVSNLYNRLASGEVSMINKITTKKGTAPEKELLVTLDDGTQIEYKLRGKRQIAEFYDFMDGFPDEYPEFDPPDETGS